MTWKYYFQEQPKKQKSYLVQRMFEDTGESYFAVERFEPQNEYERVFSKEFNQEVNILKTTSEPKFKEGSTFVSQWMEIPLPD